MKMRKDERAEDQRIRQRERAEDVNYRNETLGLQKDQAARQKSEYDYKVLERTKAKKQENLKKSVAVAKGLFKAGYEREAVGVVTKAYNSLNDKGDEGILIHKGDGGGIDAEANGPGESPWDKPEAKGANMLFLSKNFGMIPFKSAKDAINMMDSFVNGEKEDETVVIGKDQTLMNKRTGEVIGKGAGPSKLEEYKEKINLMTTTYKHLGSSLMGKAVEEDFLGPAGQPTEEANTAYKTAISILMKAEKDRKSLTPMEEKMLPIAGNMVKFYQDSLTYIGENRESLFGAKQPSGKQGLTNTPPKGGEKPINYKPAPVRAPTKSELDWFKKNPETTGMAAEDNKVILNPDSKLSATQKQAVVVNESARIYMRTSGKTPDFKVTEAQKAKFKGYGSEKDIKETIAARIFSGDSSALDVTPEQTKWVNENIGPVKTKKPGLTPPEKPITVASRDNGMSGKAVEDLGNALGISKKGESSIPKILGTGSKKARSQSSEDKAKLMERGAKVKQGISKAAEKAMGIFESENPLHYKLRKMGYDDSAIKIMTKALKAKYTKESDEEIARLIGD